MGAGADERSAIARGVAEVLGKVRREFVGEFAQRRGEERRWFAVRVTRFEGREGVRAVVVHEDITERKRVEEAERRAEALRSLARLASAAAHEINNPLAIIMGNVEIIAQQIDPAVDDRIPAHPRRHRAHPPHRAGHDPDHQPRAVPAVAEPARDARPPPLQRSRGEGPARRVAGPAGRYGLRTSAG
jgi:signal transduction histidine kinase